MSRLDHRTRAPDLPLLGAPLPPPSSSEVRDASTGVHPFPRLTRVVSQGRRFIGEVDGLRFIAIAAVVLFHLRADARHYTIVMAAPGAGEAGVHGLDLALLRTLDFGYFGVELFFVLSGFLLAMPFARWRLGLAPRPSLRTYFLRRLTRLEPPYVVAMLLLFGAGLAWAATSLALAKAGVRATTLRELPNHLPQLLASLVYQHNLIYGEASVINRVAWSLEIEVQFYVLAPLLALVFSIRPRLLRRAIILGAVLALPWLRQLTPPQLATAMSLSLPGFLEYFLTGFLLADAFLLEWGEAPPRSFRWDLASLVGWSLLGVLLSTGRASWLLAPAILIAYVGAFRGKLSSTALTRSWVTAVGGMCYSIYLLHYFVISTVGVLAQTLRLGSSFAARLAFDALLAIPTIMAVSVLFFVVLERPCMDPRWPWKLAARLRSQRDAVSAS